MLRDVATIGAAVIAGQIACAEVRAQVPADPPPQSYHRSQIEHVSMRPTHHGAVAHSVTHGLVHVAQTPQTPPIPPGPPPELSLQEGLVRNIAEQNGDHDFIMVDKALGKIILFESDTAVFGGSALTGASTADRLPPQVFSEKFSKLNALDTKVTPAGRFTVKRGRDPAYGRLLDINEIHGKDWGIAIHQVYLGIPSEHRDVRLRSSNETEKHITYGCINVAPETLQFLWKVLPKNQATPLYILPEDDTKTAAYFSPHNS
jgi:hypothetical protein